MMIRLLALSFALGGPGVAAVITQDPLNRWKAVADKVAGTVVQVQGDESRHEGARGPGVLIGQGMAVTTLRAVSMHEGASTVTRQRIQLLVPDVGLVGARVVDAAPEYDLALLLLSDEGAGLPAAPFATEVPAEGALMLAMGTGDDTIWIVGMVVSRVAGELLALESRQTADSRFWGGPLFDDQGRLAGIQLSSESGSKAVSIRLIQRMLGQRQLGSGR